MDHRSVSPRARRIAALASLAITLVAAAGLAVTTPALSSGPPSDSQVADGLRALELQRLGALVAADMAVAAPLRG